MNHSYVITEEISHNDHLLQSLIQSESIAISMLKPVYNSRHEVEDFVWVMANDLLRTHANGGEVIGRRFTDVFPDSRTNGVLDMIRKTFETGLRQQSEVYQEGGNGRSWLRQVYTRSGSFVILTAEDISLSRRVEELRAVNARLQTIDNARTRFFDNVSHEFRTPLTLILSPLYDVLESAKRKLTDDEVKKLQMANRNVARLQKLVNTLLEFSRMEAGRLDALFQPTDFVSFTTDIVSNFRSVIEEAGLKLQVKSDPVQEPIYLNRDMWEKVVLNLLSNAFKFTHAGKIQVKIHCKKLTVQLCVKDTGVGIAKRNLTRIFERFVRIENTRGRTYEGSGIGLALVKELVAMHRGTIKVRSKEGSGSTFTVTLRKGKRHLPPTQILETTDDLVQHDAAKAYVDEAREWLPETNLPVRPTRHSLSDREQPTLFVIDDNADMRQYLSHVLSPHYHVVPLTNGRMAFNLLQKGSHPDLIISDVMMPEMDGYDLVSSVKNNPALAHIPVILLSARSGDEAVVEAMDMGADDYLEKPFSSKELLSFVKARMLFKRKSHPH